jgi:DNA polymerase (family 10)
MADMLEQGEDLSRLPGIGQDLAGKIRQIVDTGHLPLLDKVSQRTPPALSEPMQIEGPDAAGCRRTTPSIRAA